VVSKTNKKFAEIKNQSWSFDPYNLPKKLLPSKHKYVIHKDLHDLYEGSSASSLTVQEIKGMWM
jgi:hypothetical protein